MLELARTPLANAVVGEKDVGKAQPLYPLDVYLCGNCGHVQLADVVDPKILYEHYVYVSGTSPVFVQHFQAYFDYLTRTFSPPGDGLVVEIGSNDGTFLKFFKQSGRRVLGVDPAQEIGEASRKAGIPTLSEFFTPAVAQKILREEGPASIVIANNCIAHIDDLGAVVDGVAQLLAPDGLFAFEVAYLVDLLEKGLFDTIYHEHLDYHSVEPLALFFERHGLELIHAQRVETHGGSLRGIVQRKGAGREVDASVRSLVALEQGLKIKDVATYRAFSGRIGKLGNELVGTLRRLAGEGKRIAGFGAPAKTTTLMYQLGIEPGMIDFIVDDSPLKQGKFTPGMHIPILPASALYDRKPDYVVVLAWNFASSIVAKHARFRDAGGKFIVPLPSLEVI